MPDRTAPSPSDHDALLAIAVGNTRISAAMFDGATPGPRTVVDAEAPHDAPGWADLRALLASADAACVSSVHPGHAERVRVLAAEAGTPLDRIGRDVPIPLRHTLEDDSTLGQDRALSALAAFSLTSEACAVVDAGTAVTVDFIDGAGVFHGGLILPGLRAMLSALHTSTAALPDLTIATPEERPDPTGRAQTPNAGAGPFGKTTAHAMRLGVVTAVNGAVRLAVERFAEHYDGYPRVIATGGDAWLFEDEDSIVERILPELQLVGIHRAWAALRNGDAVLDAASDDASGQ